MGSPAASRPATPRSSSPLLTRLEGMIGATTHASVAVCDDDKELTRRLEARRKASALRDRKRKEISARQPKPKFLDFLKHRLGEVVDPGDWRPQWTGYMRGEKQEWWKGVSEDSPWLRFMKHQENMVVGCPKKDHRIPLCQ